MHTDTACTKRRFEHVKDARYQLLRCWKRKRRERSIYWCVHCHAYHLTKKEPDNGYRHC